jgi:hypothetical protein
MLGSTVVCTAWHRQVYSMRSRTQEPAQSCLCTYIGILICSASILKISA